MTAKSRPTRPSADKTRADILKAARHLFAKQGFAGTSMSQIAKRAKVNQSLIYHHFEDKASLWKAVKHYFVQRLDAADQGFVSGCYGQDRETFIRNFMTMKFHFYNDNPEAAKMILWQAMDGENHNLSGTTDFTLQKLIDHIQQLQDKGEITQDHPAKTVFRFIAQVIHANLLSIMPIFVPKRTSANISKMPFCL